MIVSRFAVVLLLLSGLASAPSALARDSAARAAPIDPRAAAAAQQARFHRMRPEDVPPAGSTVIFDPATRSQSFRSPPAAAEGDDGARVRPGRRPGRAQSGGGEETRTPETIIGPDGRSQITDTTSYPWSTIAELFVTFPDEFTGGCSGAMVAKSYVLTAGHCVYDASHGGWAAAIEIVPGRDGDGAPMGATTAARMFSLAGWIIGGNPGHDIAIVKLADDLGRLTGWMGLATMGPGDPDYTATLNVAGYPCDKPLGTQWYDSDLGRDAFYLYHDYYMDTFGCQSGAPVWRYRDSDGLRHILSVHAYSLTSFNSGTRLNAAKFDWILDTIGGSGEVAETVAMPLFNQPDGTYAKPLTVRITSATAGATLYYTLDGSTPARGNDQATPMSNGDTVTLTLSATLKARAYLDGLLKSVINRADYIVKPKVRRVTFSPSGGIYSGSVEVTLATKTRKTLICYTLDGSAPTKAAGPCVARGGAVVLYRNSQLRARAYRGGYLPSRVRSDGYTLRVRKPRFNPGGGAFSGPVDVTIRSKTPGAVIYYTTDGAKPTKANGKRLDNGGSVRLSPPKLLKARAYHKKMKSSRSQSADYVVE